MNLKTFVFFVVLALCIAFGLSNNAFASDDEPEASVSETETIDTEVETVETYVDYVFLDTWNDLNCYINDNAISYETALIVNSLYLQNKELRSDVKELKNISAMLLILVVFETLRIVRSWSKEMGVK